MAALPQYSAVFLKQRPGNGPLLFYKNGLNGDGGWRSSHPPQQDQASRHPGIFRFAYFYCSRGMGGCGMCWQTDPATMLVV